MISSNVPSNVSPTSGRSGNSVDDPIFAGGPTSSEFKSNESSIMSHTDESPNESSKLNVKQRVDLFNKLASSGITNKLKAANEKIKNQNEQINNYQNGKNPALVYSV